jgi:hypothetical protein
MAKHFQHPIFLISILGLFIHQIIQKGFGIHTPFVDSYLDDFLAMPFILTIVSVEQRYIWKRIQRPLNIVEIMFYTLVFAVFFEEVLPRLHDGYTRDNWDYLAYLLGSLLFFQTYEVSKTYRTYIDG